MNYSLQFRRILILLSLFAIFINIHIKGFIKIWIEVR